MVEHKGRTVIVGINSSNSSRQSPPATLEELNALPSQPHITGIDPNSIRALAWKVDVELWESLGFDVSNRDGREELRQNLEYLGQLRAKKESYRLSVTNLRLGVISTVIGAIIALIINQLQLVWHFWGSNGSK